MSKPPFVSLITVNWNGINFLKDWVPSVMDLNYPAYEVIVVDNGSTDGSVAYLEANYPNIQLIKNKTNRAFAGGNNDGIRKVLREGKSKYVALINNDTKVHKNWLKELVETDKNTENVGAVGSKLLFYMPFVQLKLKTSTSKPESDPRQLGVGLWNSPAFQNVNYEKQIWGEGFYPQEYYGEDELRWTQSEATVSIPIEKSEDSILSLTLQGHHHNQKVGIYIGDNKLNTITVNAQRRNYQVKIDKNILEKHRHDVIQNAGSTFNTKEFEGGDRGMYEIDRGQYDKVEEVDNLCGASMLIPVKVLKASGLFDEYFFMYYEDTDLCQRIKKSGYRLMYNPRSLVRHIHTGSSKEWSPFFVYHVERNRIANAIKNANVMTIIYLVIRIKKIWLTHTIKTIRDPKDSINKSKFSIYTKVLINLLLNCPQLLLKRFKFIKIT